MFFWNRLYIFILLVTTLTIVGAGCQSSKEIDAARQTGFEIGYRSAEHKWREALEECNDIINEANDYCDESYTDINDTICELSEVSEP